MKSNFKTLIIISTIAFFMVSAFQCASPEMTSAKLYLQRKDMVKAEEQLKLEVSKNPKNSEAFFLLGQMKYDQKDYKAMKDYFANSLAADIKFEKEIKNFTLSGWAFKFNEGVDALNNAIEDTTIDRSIAAFEVAYYILPESTANSKNLGLAHYRRGNKEDALKYLKIAFDKEQDDMSIRVIGRIYSDGASDLKNKYLDVNTDVLEGLRNLNSIQEKTKAEDVKYILGAPSSIEKPKDKKSKKEDWIYEKYGAKILMDGGYVSSIDKSGAIKPDSTLLLQSRIEFSKAVEFLQIGITKFPEDSEISEMLMNAYIGAERNSEARSLLQSRVVKYPESKFDHYNLGVFLLKDNDYEGSIKHFENALKLDDKFSAARYNLAASYVNWGIAEQERLKKLKKEDDKSFNEKYKLALPFLEKIIEEKSDDIQMLELLGQVHANLGNAKKAEEYYKKADDLRSGKK